MKKSEILDRAKSLLRIQHKAYSTEKAYLAWISRYIDFIKTLPATQPSEAKAEAFLSHLAQVDEVAASTQNVAFSAVLFLYAEVLKQPLTGVNALRAKRGRRVPDVLSHDDALRVISHITGDDNRLIAQLLYGSGLRLNEALRLRVKDIDFKALRLTIRDGKGDKDRVTILSPSLVEPLRLKVERRRAQHKADLAAGVGSVYLPDALARKYPNAATDFGWQYVFASPRIATDPRSGARQRHHILDTNVQRAITRAAQECKLDQRVSPHVFRHSFATRMLEKGVPLHQLKDVLGHESIETTAIYLHTVEISGRTIISPLDT